MNKIYNMNAIVQKTGITANTLRAWERRYQLPMPTRSKGGQRQYSEEDVNTVKWLLARKNEGMGIRLAVDLWNEIKTEGGNPLEEMSLASAKLALSSDRDTKMHSPEDYRQSWLNACLEFDGAKADRVIAEAFGIYDTQVVCLEILQDALVEIGTLWYEGKATVQQEHFASGLAVRKINALISANTDPTREERVVIATPPNEEHVISSLILTLFLRQSGYRVVNLGANVPIEGLKIMLSIIDPTLVVLSATHLGSLRGLLETANYLAEQETPVAYGGRIFNEYAELQGKIPGEYLGYDLMDSRQRIEEMLQSEPEKPRKWIVSSELQNSWKVYAQNRQNIENQASEAFEGADKVLEFQHRFVADNVEANLTLGLDDPLQGELHWANDYSEKNELNIPLLSDYLKQYLEASKSELGDSGLPVQNWLLGALKILEKAE